MQLLAPAKINLFFQIKGCRSDGFHEIETLMAPVSLSDRLTIEKSSRGNAIHFSCDDPSLPTGVDNLVVRAATIFRQRMNLREGITIVLEKKIPHAAGLGGGSSDAASTLMGLNDLFQTNLSGADLSQLAAGLGSDVPFFLSQTAAICRGRGESVTAAPLAKKYRLLLLKPAFGVPTAWAYGRWKNSEELPGVEYQAQEFGGTRFENDLERPVFEKFVLLAHLKNWLRAQTEVAVALMSGSGSTVFAVLHDGVDSAELAARARGEIDANLWSCECETG